MTRSIESVFEQVKGIDKKLDDGYVRKDVYEQRLNVLEKRQGSIEKNIKWFVRIVLGTVVLSVLSLVFIEVK